MVYSAVSPNFYLIDVAPLNPGEGEVPGIYIAGNSHYNRSTPSGVTLFISRDGGTTYHEFGALDGFATVGRMGATNNDNGDGTTISFADYENQAAPLALAKSRRFFEVNNVNMGGGTWDNQSQLIVNFNDNQTPTSATEIEVLNGSNEAIIASRSHGTCEVVAYKTATLIAGDAFALTDLLRGRRGTEGNIITREAGAPVILKNSYVKFFPLEQADINRTLHFKALTRAMAITHGSALAQSIAFSGLNVTPLPPAEVTATRDGSNNLTIAWKRRSRYRSRLFSGAPLAYGQDLASYEVDILDDSVGSNVLRTIKVTTESASYTAAQQLTDSITPGGEAVNLRVYQMSNWVGRGLANIWTIPAGSTANHKLYATRIS